MLQTISIANLELAVRVEGFERVVQESAIMLHFFSASAFKI